jgi:hypothetical protein
VSTVSTRQNKIPATKIRKEENEMLAMIPVFDFGNHDPSGVVGIFELLLKFGQGNCRFFLSAHFVAIIYKVQFIRLSCAVHFWVELKA